MLMMGALSFAAVGCGSDGGGGGDTGEETEGETEGETAGETEEETGEETGAMGMDNPPAMGDQIDRMGRAAISTATVGVFADSGPDKDNLKDAYNAASGGWGDFAADIQFSIGVLDSLDTVCGNQLLADGIEGDSEDRYSTLAGVLADDQLYLNSESGDCSIYLGLEAQVVGALTDGGCGGRTLGYDVIATSYTVLAAGALDLSYDDTITADDAEALGEFPYVAAPLE